MDTLSNESEVSLICPKICDPINYYNRSAKNVFFLKHNDNYELIVKTSLNGSKYDLILKHDNDDIFNIIEGLRFNFIKSCQILNKEKNRNFITNSYHELIQILNKIAKKNPEYEPKYQLINNLFKTIAIITKNLTIIPIYPSKIVDSLDIISIMNEVTLDPITLYNNLLKIKKLSKGKITCNPISYSVISKGDYNYYHKPKNYIYLEKDYKKNKNSWIIGIKFTNDLIIPTKWHKIEKNDKFDLKLTEDEYVENIDENILYNTQFLDDRIIEMNKIIYSQEFL